MKNFVPPDIGDDDMQFGGHAVFKTAAKEVRRRPADRANRFTAIGGSAYKWRSQCKSC
jgi:hypothetical protein